MQSVTWQRGSIETSPSRWLHPHYEELAAEVWEHTKEELDKGWAWLDEGCDLGDPMGSVGMALVLPALTDCRWWFESLLVHSGVSSATRRKATGADHKKNR